MKSAVKSGETLSELEMPPQNCSHKDHSKAGESHISQAQGQGFETTPVTRTEKPFLLSSRSRNRCEIEDNIPPRYIRWDPRRENRDSRVGRKACVGRGTGTELWWKRKEEAGNGSESRERVAVRSYTRTEMRKTKTLSEKRSSLGPAIHVE